MGIEELRDSVNGIRMTEDMKRAVIRNVTDRTEGSRRVQKGEGQGQRHASGWRRGLAAAAVVLMAAGIAAVPVRAFVNSLVRERVDEMSSEEKESYVETLKEQKTEADGFSRTYTEQEKARYDELAQRYQEGTFPKQAVPQAKDEEEAGGYEFCYLVPDATFCLPERELTDEELLEIIDFLVKREYAYREDYSKEHAQEIAAKMEQEQAAVEENVESGGITQQQAIETAARKLSEIFGMTGEGFEQNAYYNEPEEGRRADYCVNWTNFISHKYYYFNIDAKDGHMVRASYSGEDVYGEAPLIPSEQVQDKLPALQAAAETVMQEKVGVPYEKVYVYYLNYEDGSAGNGVRFYFADERQNAYKVAYTWDGILYEIEERSLSGLEDGQEVELWNGGKETYDKAKAVFQEVSR